ncbi:hypothetical protein K431DRAFT_288292 [Polychaeton citri CBS 116435]|uniref:Uncharacterized protein n=1 Tax=Polychaeton citri CBS 116435 TaxID=1314669 RepID=A0A9P4Q1H8_9PEZI|nr:hypothetical protein K431DRAFT_288292 [Polychaeton citri CBS 116435]
MTTSASLWLTVAAICFVAVVACFASSLPALLHTASKVEVNESDSILVGSHRTYCDEDGEALGTDNSPGERPRQAFVVTQVLMLVLTLSEIVLGGLGFALSSFDVQYGLILGGWVC